MTDQPPLQDLQFCAQTSFRVRAVTGKRTTSKYCEEQYPCDQGRSHEEISLQNEAEKSAENSFRAAVEHILRAFAGQLQ